MAVFYHLEIGTETEVKHLEFGVGIPEHVGIGTSEELLENLHAAHESEIPRILEKHEDYELVRWWIENDHGERVFESDQLPEVDDDDNED